MKKTYVKPTAQGEIFVPNEYVAACDKESYLGTPDPNGSSYSGMPYHIFELEFTCANCQETFSFTEKLPVNSSGTPVAYFGEVTGLITTISSDEYWLPQSSCGSYKQINKQSPYQYISGTRAVKGLKYSTWDPNSVSADAVNGLHFAPDISYIAFNAS